jgi:hypothetical protein
MLKMFWQAVSLFGFQLEELWNGQWYKYLKLTPDTLAKVVGEFT